MHGNPRHDGSPSIDLDTEIIRFEVVVEISWRHVPTGKNDDAKIGTRVNDAAFFPVGDHHSNFDLAITTIDEIELDFTAPRVAPRVSCLPLGKYRRTSDRIG